MIAKTPPTMELLNRRERRAAIIAAAKELEFSGCLRIACHTRGPLLGEPEEIRLSSVNVEMAYEKAEQMGFEPLALGLAAVSRRAQHLAEEGPLWMREFLHRFAEGARKAQLSTIGMRRERFKRLAVVKFSAEPPVPVLGDFLGFGEAFFFRGGAAVLAGEISGALPKVAVRTLVNVDFAAQNSVVFWHVDSSEEAAAGNALTV
jgi:hypothetical protein